MAKTTKPVDRVEDFMPGQLPIDLDPAEKFDLEKNAHETVAKVTDLSDLIDKFVALPLNRKFKLLFMGVSEIRQAVVSEHRNRLRADRLYSNGFESAQGQLNALGMRLDAIEKRFPPEEKPQSTQGELGLTPPEE